ncbi:major facilitator superfamily domain-containing protein [Exophiala viscosa]|uniref:Major facilitator superfamily domain-containing protein n=1 Tax=Exophiala viscosa TaxID=2486360 RepID=A0AAN6IHI9_9EURO|nr:major facilitator superfamily domain-containing protein [Exophiala viscosa]KAI1626828.1 major facilitator superfamily domain-containing protein [Exophiala viscosa]
MRRDVETRPVRPGAPPSWGSIPNKFQIFLLFTVRFVDFFQQAALQAYMFYQLKSFRPDADDSQISFEAGVLQGIFTAAQVFTGILWGRVADSPRFGRKTVLLIGLTGQGISCIGVAFSRSFTVAAIWRCLGGAVNATVGGARTSLAESTEKKYHSRTFLILPLAWNVANIFGPLVGGLLADPVTNYPGLFGAESTFGGNTGVQWLQRFPYALPNMFCALVMFADAVLIWTSLRETLASRKFSRDRGIEIAEIIRYKIDRLVFRKFGYSLVSDVGPDTVEDDENQPSSTQLSSLSKTKADDRDADGDRPDAKQQQQQQQAAVAAAAPPFYHALTPNVLMVLATVAAMDFQMGGFAQLWTVFLSSARRTDAERSTIALPFYFTGGLQFSLPTIGLAMSILGFVGIILQLTLYPNINARYGLLRSFRVSLLVFPLAYALAPYLSLLINHTFMLWCGIVVVVILQVAARTFAIPGSVLLINNSSPGPQLLGTIHGMGAATSSAFRTIGPIVAGHWYGQGLEKGIVGWAWWWLALVSLVGVLPSLWAKDGK